MSVLLAGSSGRILTESAAVPHKRQVIMYSCVTKRDKSISIIGTLIITAVCLWHLNLFISFLSYFKILKDLSGSDTNYNYQLLSIDNNFFKLTHKKKTTRILNKSMEAKVLF